MTSGAGPGATAFEAAALTGLTLLLDRRYDADARNAATCCACSSRLCRIFRPPRLGKAHASRSAGST